MLLVLTAILVCTAAGVAVERRLGDEVGRVTGPLIRVLVWVLQPFIYYFVVARLELGGDVGAGLALAWGQLLVLVVVTTALATRVLRLPPAVAGAVVVCTIQVNTGYLGAPLVAALLGRDAIHDALVYDSLVTNFALYTLAFGVGAAMGTTSGDTARSRLRAFLTRSPALYAALLGLVAPDALAPHVLSDAAEIAALGTLPIGFFLLGANLVHEERGLGVRFPPPVTPPVALVLGLRLAVAPLLLFGLSRVLAPDIPDAFLLQAGMPSGINALVVGHLYGLDLRVTAAAVAWTTAIAVLVAVALSPVLG